MANVRSVLVKNTDQPDRQTEARWRALIDIVNVNCNVLAFEFESFAFDPAVRI